jgi:hypothetical protein
MSNYKLTNEYSADESRPLNGIPTSWDVDCTMVEPWLSSLDRANRELVLSMAAGLGTTGPTLPYPGVHPVVDEAGKVLLYEWRHDISGVANLCVLFAWDAKETAVLLAGQAENRKWSRKEIDAVLMLMYLHELKLEQEESSELVLAGCGR